MVLGELKEILEISWEREKSKELNMSSVTLAESLTLYLGQTKQKKHYKKPKQ